MIIMTIGENDFFGGIFGIVIRIFSLFKTPGPPPVNGAV